MAIRFAAWTAATHCTGSATPGARAFAKVVLDVFRGIRNGGIYNCVSGETLVLTPDGDVPISELAGTIATVLTMGERCSPRWVEAPVRSYGVQPLLAVTLERGVDRQIIHATAEHRWLTRYKRSGSDGGGLGHTERTTADLREGHVIPSVFPRSGASRVRHFGAGIPHGLVYGDGTLDSTGGARIALFGAKKLPLASYFPNQVSSVGQRPEDAEPYAIITGLSRTWKSLPSPQESSAYLYGFLAGWFAADGRVTSGGAPTLYCADREALEAARLLARRVGIGTYPIRETKMGGSVVGGNWLEPRVGYTLSFVMAHLDGSFFLQPNHRERFNAAPNGRRPADWRVVSVEATDRFEEVFCAEVPGTANFVLAEYVLTGNCRSVVGGTTTSCHGEGRAFDAMCSIPDGDVLVKALLAAGPEDMGIQAIIHNRRIYSRRSPSGRPYVGPGLNPHVDHVHIEFTRAAGRNLTAATVRALLGHHTPPPATGALARGSTGEAVKTLQTALHVEADGVFGPATERAVNRLKAAHGLPQDGVAGTRVLAVLGL